MTIKRRILLTLCIFSLASSALASGTKVGNGDDGGDLEGTEPIRAGLIWETRYEAVELSNKLRLRSVEGLGLLIPELERSELVMAQHDVRPPKENFLSFEISDDGQKVYARTFAEPHAATRFFPAAKNLNRSQLVALHIHEALHRALPPEIREDEDIVMHLTLAITSPGASFDRVNRVARRYMSSTGNQNSSEVAGMTRSTLSSQHRSLPKTNPTKFSYEYRRYTDGGPNTPTAMTHVLGLELSPLGPTDFRGTVIEPVLVVRAALDVTTAGHELVKPENYVHGRSSDEYGHLGAVVLEAQGRVLLERNMRIGPLLRNTLKSPSGALVLGNHDRNVFTVGGFFVHETSQHYVNTSLEYSFGESSLAERYNGIVREVRARVGDTWSLTTRAGWQWRRFSMGAIGELHSSAGVESNEEGTPWIIDGRRVSMRLDGFTLLVLGPEVGISLGRYRIDVHGRWIAGPSEARLEDLGDNANRGSGKGYVGANLRVQI